MFLIANPTRNISIPLRSFYDCTTDAGADLSFASGADTLPDFINSATDGVGMYIEWDDAGGALDIGYVCSNFQVPQDYASGGSFRISWDKDGETTGTNSEVVNVNANINYGALATVDSDNLVGATEQELVSTPTVITYAAGDSVGVVIYITGPGTMDDAV